MTTRRFVWEHADDENWSAPSAFEKYIVNQQLSIRTWTESFPTNEGVAVVFDVFRCSTTIHSLFSRNIGPVLVASSLKDIQQEPRVREMRVFSELSQPVECRERFDNSPFSALESPWKEGLTSLVATTSGTPAMFMARNFERVYVGSLVNFSALVAHLSQISVPITLIPATFPEHRHVEDEITAQAIATALEGFSNMPEFVRQCADNAREQIVASGRPAHLEQKLSTGKADMEISLHIDRLPQVLSLEFESGPHPLFATVRAEK